MQLFLQNFTYGYLTSTSTMASRSCTAALVCLSAMYGTPTVRGGSCCGFVTPCVSLFQRSSLTRSAAGRMTVSEETEVPAPYSELPTDWRSPLQGGNAVPEAESEREEGVEEEQQRAAPPSREDASVRTPAQVLQDATRVTPSAAMSVARLGVRTMPSPPGIDSSLQTENQRRRALPLSKLKRVKPKRKVVEEEEGEYRPLLPKTDRESVLRGEDYWIDYKEVDAKAARKEARAKAPAADQFSQSKMKAEIVNPYKQNWILVISIAVVAITVFVRINPGILDDPAIITFPSEL